MRMVCGEWIAITDTKLAKRFESCLACRTDADRGQKEPFDRGLEPRTDTLWHYQ